MSIPSVTETAMKAPAPPVPPAASGVGTAKDPKKEAAAHAVQPIEEPPPAAPPPPPPPPPVEGFDDEVMVGVHAATKRKVYDFVDPDDGTKVQQIPVEAVLNLVGQILQQLEAEGLR